MALLLTRLPPWQRPGRAMLIAVCGFGAATIGLGLSTTFALSWMCLLFTGIFDEISVLVRQTLEQLITPDHLRGRVASINHIFIGFSNQFGAFWSGGTAALMGLVPAVVVGGVCSIAVALVVSRRFPNLVGLGPLSSLSPAQEPEVIAPLPSKAPSR